MPKTEINYSNTIIYKITCNDTNIKDVYVGHTTNFVQRKYAHKQTCINEKSSSYKCKLYDVIRNNGGWNNWNMEIINFFNCKDHYEARIKEQEYFVSLNANLNSIEPLPKPKPIIIEEKIEKLEKNLNRFVCNSCDFKCYMKCDWDRHIIRPKHLNAAEGNHKINKKLKKTYNCDCSKTFMSKSGLWKHKKVCNQQVNIKEEVEKESDEILEKKDNNDLIQYLIKENQDLKNLVLEVCKNFQVTNIIKK